jgi:hypothetical protein
VAAGDQSNVGTSLHNVPGSLNATRQEHDARRKKGKTELYDIDESRDVADHPDGVKRNSTLDVVENCEEKDEDAKTTMRTTEDYSGRMDELIDEAGSVSTKNGSCDDIDPDVLKQFNDAIGAELEWSVDDFMAEIDDAVESSDSDKDVALHYMASSTKNAAIVRGDSITPSSGSDESSSYGGVFPRPDFLWDEIALQRDLDFSDDSDEVPWDVGVIEKDPYEIESSDDDPVSDD